MGFSAAAAAAAVSSAPLVPLAGDWPQFFDTLHWLQAVMAALSVMGSSSMIGYAVFQNAARSPEVRPLFYLSVSDLCLGICWLVGALLYGNETSEKASLGNACYNLQTLGQFVYGRLAQTVFGGESASKNCHSSS